MNSRIPENDADAKNEAIKDEPTYQGGFSGTTVSSRSVYARSDEARFQSKAASTQVSAVPSLRISGHSPVSAWQPSDRLGAHVDRDFSISFSAPMTQQAGAASSYSSMRLTSSWSGLSLSPRGASPLADLSSDQIREKIASNEKRLAEARRQRQIIPNTLY